MAAETLADKIIRFRTREEWEYDHEHWRFIAEVQRTVRTRGSWRRVVEQIRTAHTREEDEVLGMIAKCYLLHWSRLSPSEMLEQMYGIRSIKGGA